MAGKQSDQYFERILDLAEPNALTQGEELFVDGRVVSVRHAQGRLRAMVEDGEGYPIVIDARGALDYSCECADALRGAFCKHLVAGALQWASQPAAKRGNRRPKADSREAARRSLALLSKEELISRLVDWSREDADLRERLDLLAARMSGKRIKTTPYKKAIRAATQARKLLSQRETTQTTGRVRRILGELRELLDQGAAAEVVELTELAVDRIMQLAPRLGYRSDAADVLLGEAGELHVEACEEAEPDPQALAACLYKWELSGWEAFRDSSRVYEHSLGASGRRAFLRLAQSEWDKLPVLKPGENRYGYGYDYDHDYGASSSRSQLAELLKSQARSEGDVDRLVEICKKDLSSPSNHLEISEILRDAGRFDEAVEWARKSIDKFPGNVQADSLRLLADLHRQAGRGEEALRLIWNWFAAAPSVQSYSAVIEQARAAGCEAEYREKSLAEIRGMIERAKVDPAARRMRNTQYGWFCPPDDRSLLVEILLDEGDLEAAHAEMDHGGCNVEIALSLAAASEADLPVKALEVYWRCVRSQLRITERASYQRAVQLLERMADLAERAGRRAEFRQDLLELRRQYRQRSSLIGLLSNAGLS